MKIKLSQIKNTKPRREHGDISALRDSIKECGLIQPLVIDEAFNLLAGRRRYQALTELGYTETECHVLPVNGDQVNAFRIAIHENTRRKQLTEVEEAVANNELHEMMIRQYGEKPAGNPSKFNTSNIDQLKGWTQEKTAQELETSRPTISRDIKIANAIKKHPILIKKKTGKEVLAEANKIELAEAGAKQVAQAPTWSVEVADINTYQTDKRFDFIITDPPYPREYLPLYEVLAERAKEWLKPNGLLIVMCGQSYLDQIYAMLSNHLSYYWTACYLVPGQAVSLRQKQVNTNWKPILIFSPSGDYSGKTFGDVYSSEKREKESHEWGQSVSGMLSLISQVCLPGESIFDPFLGAGATGVAAITHGCLFSGIDIDGQSVNISKKRLSDIK